MSQMSALERRAERKSRKGSGVDLNLVALIDVFTILIFFLLSTAVGVETLVSPRKVQLPLANAEQAPKETVVLVIAGDEILVDGRPVASVTHLQIGLRARPLADGDFGLEVASVQNGVRLVEVGAMSFPAAAARRNQQGTVQVVATVHPDGRVEVHETRGDAPRALHAAASRMLRSSRFEPEQVDGRPVAARIEKPVRFVLVAAPPGRHKLPVEVGDGPWPAREDDAFRTLDSAVRLLTPVEGRALGETAASEVEAP